MPKPFLREILKRFYWSESICRIVRVQFGIYLEEFIAWIFEGVRLNPKGAIGNGVEVQALEHLLDVDYTFRRLNINYI